MPKLPRHNSYKFIQLGFYKVIGSGILSQAQLYFMLKGPTDQMFSVLENLGTN